MYRDFVFAAIRWAVGIGLIGCAWVLISTCHDGEGPIDLTRLVLGGVAFLAGVAVMWRWIFSLATRPLMTFVDSLYFPGGQLEKPVLNLKLPAHYVNEGRYEEALAEYGQILKHYPKEPEAYEKSIWILCAVENRPAEAARLLRRARRRGLPIDEGVVALVERDLGRRRFPE